VCSLDENASASAEAFSLRTAPIAAALAAALAELARARAALAEAEQAQAQVCVGYTAAVHLPVRRRCRPHIRKANGYTTEIQRLYDGYITDAYRL
jgi:hypothetical protein